MILSVSQPGSETVERPGSLWRQGHSSACAVSSVSPVLSCKAAPEWRRLEEPGNTLPFSAARLPWGPGPAALRGPPRSEHSERAALEALGLTA